MPLTKVEVLDTLRVSPVKRSDPYADWIVAYREDTVGRLAHMPANVSGDEGEIDGDA